MLRWLLRLGGPGLILLGIADNSVIPLPGSMDVLNIYLAARHHNLWPYYALMSTIGAVLVGVVARERPAPARSLSEGVSGRSSAIAVAEDRPDRRPGDPDQRPG